MDLLLYRYPNQSIVQKNGRFEVINLFTQNYCEGFVISDFNKNQTFLFQESDYKLDFSKFQFHFSNKVPYVISKQNYIVNALNFKNEIINKGLKKAVFSRVKEVELTSQNYFSFFENLCQKYPNAFVYLISSKSFGTWIGATPEQLLKTEDNIAHTVSLAGTKKNNLISWTNKEIEEQEYVTRHILATIENYKQTVLNCSETFTYQAGPVYHLKSNINFDFDKKELISIIRDLHPTPAVSGLPVKESIDLISLSEDHERSLYTGFLGLISKDNSNIFVNLRCAQLIGKSAFLYLGGGFTKDSDLIDEWVETENKALTLTQVFLKNT